VQQSIIYCGCKPAHEIRAFNAGVFMADLSDSIFILHEPDKAARIDYLLGKINPSTNRNWTRAELDALPKSFWNDSCRRKIPPPSELSARLQECYARHQHDVDSAGVPLFTTSMAACHERQMQLIQAGYLSGMQPIGLGMAAQIP
jgi:hypothetical protein